MSSSPNEALQRKWPYNISPNPWYSDLWFAVRMPFLWRWKLGYWAGDSTLIAWRIALRIKP